MFQPVVLARPRQRVAVLFALLVAVALFAGGSQASAGTVTYWSSFGPTGNASTNVPIKASGTASSDGSPLVSDSLKLSIDGHEVPRSLYSASVLSTYVYVYYVPKPALADGPHTFKLEVADAAGKVSSKEWSATIIQPPNASWVAPGAGSTVYTGRPRIVMSLSDNTAGTTVAVEGQVHAGSATGPVVAMFGGSGLALGEATFALPAELPFGTYYLTADVTDAAGNLGTIGGTAARAFTTASAPAMTVLESCDACHSTLREAHPAPTTTDCMVCHPGYDGDHMEGTYDCEDCHTSGWHSTVVAVRSSCISCHNSSRPAIPRHTAANSSAAHAGSCGGCHDGSLIARHGVTPSGSTYNYQCELCHGSEDAAVEAAILAGDTDCDACHESGYHPDFDAKHTAPSGTCGGAACHASTSLTSAHEAYVGPGGRYPQYPDTCSLCHRNDDPQRVPAEATADCATCHPDRVAYHGYDPQQHTATVTSATVTILGSDFGARTCSSCHASAELGPLHDNRCATCHPSPAESALPWAGGCVQGDCHSATSSAPQHADIDSAHVIGGQSCTATGCHSGGTNSASVHKTQGCETCHATGRTATNACATCHDLDSPHGDEQATHASSVGADCTGCHTPNLVGEHVTDLGLTCAGCHASPDSRVVTAIESNDTSCAACHEIHGDIDAAHQSTTDCYGSCHARQLTDAGHVADCQSCHASSQQRVTAAIDAGKTDCGTCHRAGSSYVDESGKAFVLVGAQHDGIQPAISNVTFTYVGTAASPKVTWTTDRPTTTYVDYTGPDWSYDGENFNGYTYTAGTSSLSTAHAVSFPAPSYSSSSGYFYHYRIRTVDAQGRVAVTQKRLYHRNRSGSRVYYPVGYEPDYGSLNTDNLILNVVRPNGSKLTSVAVAGWDSEGTTAAMPTPMDPGTQVSQAVLASGSSKTYSLSWWRTKRATSEGAYNWQIAEFRLDPTLLQGMQGLQVDWTGYGENSTGHPVVLYLWNLDTQKWERLDSRQSTGYNTGVRLTDSADPAQHYCLRCHSTPVSAQVSMPSSLTNMRVAWTTDYHGVATGAGFGGSLKAPYARGQAALACDACHEPTTHGGTSGNLAKIRTTVNGSPVTVRTGTEAASLCSACHAGTPNQIHASCISCHQTPLDYPYHNLTGQAPTDFANTDCLSCHRHGRTGYAPGCHTCHNETGAGPWTTF